MAAATFEQKFYIRAEGEFQYVGTIIRPWQHTYELTHPPRSLAYFCRDCGEIWARAHVVGHHDYWRLCIRRCREHGEGFLGYECEEAYVKNFHSELLRREFLIASNNPKLYLYHYS